MRRVTGPLVGADRVIRLVSTAVVGGVCTWVLASSTVETSGICRSLTTSRLLLGGWCNASHSLEVLLECLALLHDLSLLSIEVTVGIDTTDRAQRIINKDVDIRSIKQVFADGLGSSQCSCNGIESLLKGVKTEAVLCFVGLICSEKRLIRLGAEDASLDDGPAEAFDQLAVMTAIVEWLESLGHCHRQSLVDLKARTRRST